MPVSLAAGNKGELKTWVDTNPGCVVKTEAVMANGRFSIDLDALYLFSSGNAAMMPGHSTIHSLVHFSLRLAKFIHEFIHSLNR